MKDKKKTTQSKTKTTVKTPKKELVAPAKASVSAPVMDMKCSKCAQWVTCLLNTQYNLSIWLLTLIIWVFTSNLITYNANGNFDMLLTLHNYIQLLSLVAVIVGLMRVDNKQYMLLTKYGISAYLLSILTIIFTKNYFYTMVVAQLVLKPASIFFFLMIIKQVWNVAVGKK